MANTRILEVVAAIHKRVREQAASYETPTVLEDWSNDLAKLSGAYNAAYTARNLVGSAPVLPNTLLGYVAGFVTRIAQRMLFWYTPQIQQFHDAATSVLGRVCSLEERTFRTFLSLADRVERLELENRLLKAAGASETSIPAAGPPPSGETPTAPERPASGSYIRSHIDADNFFFELQGRFQPAVQADIDRLTMYRTVIGNLDPRVPAGAWLDIGCGRGKWLRLAREAGYEAIGVDSNPAAIRQCREGGFDVTESDALGFLQSMGDQSLAVVSAFHVLEHCAFDYCLNLVYQIARALRPGGVLLIETPHPGNLLMAAEQFWMDPTHRRPIPLPLAEFLFEYCGLSVVHRFEVNPRPEPEHLPLRELDVVNRLDLLLYGPQDYALIGRRAV
jgi:SAM-dependent methyltransferase